jgi:tryptophan synthase alpha chain
VNAAPNRIDDVFRAARDERRAVLMPFLTGGYPTPDVTRHAVAALREAGAEIVEIGFPFSDPIADGPVIASSMHEALERGITPDDVFGLTRALTREVPADSLPALVAMVSISLVHAASAEHFCRQASEAGFSGLIIPDADLEDADELRAACDRWNLRLSLLIAPTTSDDRIRRIIERTTGFVYLLARAGITGESDGAPDVRERIGRLRALTDLPIAVGFGISNPSHVASVTAQADAAIVGSAVVRKMTADPDRAAEAAVEFVRDLANGLRRGHPPAL